MRRSSSMMDLWAFVAVLLAGVLLILLGVSPQSIASVAVGLATLYAAWQGRRPPASFRSAPADLDAEVSSRITPGRGEVLEAFDPEPTDVRGRPKPTDADEGVDRSDGFHHP